MFKIGDKIAFIKVDVEHIWNNCEVGWGYIFWTDGFSLGCCRKGASPQYFNIEDTKEHYWVIADDSAKGKLLDIVNILIAEQQNRIKSLTSEEKDILVKTKFNSICNNIKATAMTMIHSSDETQFINCLKEICRLKTQLFSIKIKDLDNIHKSNGTIKATMRELSRLREKIEYLEFE